MAYWAKVKSNELIDISACKFLDNDILNIETTENFFNLYSEDKNKVAYINNEIVENPEYIEVVRAKKYNEANIGAKSYIESGRALYELEDGDHIEATDGNISKIGLKVTSLIISQDYETTFTWNTKEDNNIELNALQGKAVVEGLEAIQAQVWTVKFPYYCNLINNATTIAEIEAIIIDYDSEEIPLTLS